ncbi:hypothetical protein HYW18_02895 [Candidatus Uhrbacteria bacterium]|nr:hypothetical protein [Candidatus Uhrbacteria bacterium]
MSFLFPKPAWQYNERGSILLEAVLAAAILITFFGAAAGLAVTVNQETGSALIAQEALWRTMEGIEAMKTIRFDDLPITNPGIVVWNGTSWSVAAGGPESLPGGFSRSVSVTEVERDSNCLVVPTGGTVDPDSKDVEATTNWTDTAGRVQTVSHSAIRTRYQTPTNPCFLNEQSSSVILDVSEAEWFGGKQLREIEIENTGGADVVIDKIIFTWTNASTISQVFIESVKVWSDTGPGTPPGPQLTGTTLNIADYTLSPSDRDEMNKAQFADNMEGTVVTLTLVFGDGSTLTSDPFIPD